MITGTRANDPTSTHAATYDVSRLNVKNMLSTEGRRTRISARSLSTMVRPIGDAHQRATAV